METKGRSRERSQSRARHFELCTVSDGRRNERSEGKKGRREMRTGTRRDDTPHHPLFLPNVPPVLGMLVRLSRSASASPLDCFSLDSTAPALDESFPSFPPGFILVEADSDDVEAEVRRAGGTGMTRVGAGGEGAKTGRMISGDDPLDDPDAACSKAPPFLLSARFGYSPAPSELSPRVEAWDKLLGDRARSSSPRASPSTAPSSTPAAPRSLTR